MAKPLLAISAGDPAGIGAEIIVKALARPELCAHCAPIVIGDAVVFEDTLRLCRSSLVLHCLEKPEDAAKEYGVIDLLDMKLLGTKSGGSWEYGRISAAAGNAAFHYVTCALQFALEQRVAGIVTAPINKEALNLAGHHYAGHTEILAERTGTKNYAMLLIAGDCSARCLRVVHVTTHVSIKQAVSLITEMRVLAVIRLAANGLRLLGCEKPRIAVAGLNPHASENSLFGNEEADIIMPAIEKAQSEGYDVTGPLPPDTVFVKALAGLFDVVVAMYHDQGHIPLKLVGFMPDSAFSRISGVNCTLGIPVIRTSVDHGTAFDKAGKNCSSEQSMVEAIEAACMMANTKNRICGACNEL